MDEKTCVYALEKAFPFETKVPAAIIRQLGSAAALFEMSRDEMASVIAPCSKISQEIAAIDLPAAERELKAALSGRDRADSLRWDCSYVTMTDKEYPSRLKECEDAPAGLFVRTSGDIGSLFDIPCVSVVGTREPDDYGREWCRKIVRALARSPKKPCIVSGLAYGIDITAHCAALDEGAPTIAVLGTGIGNIYPRFHIKYAREILQRNGCAIVSEYPPGFPVKAVNFLSRNRIVAGLSDTLVLVQSRVHGGGMTTANQAFSYSRNVYALPGSNDNPLSLGCNTLIAAMVAGAIVSETAFAAAAGYPSPKPSALKKSLGVREFYEKRNESDVDMLEKVAMAIPASRSISVEEIMDKVNMPYKDVITAVSMLESDGFITTDLLRRCSLAVK